MPPRAVLAAVDFSAPSRVALEFAGRLARHCHASLQVLHATDPLLAAAARAQGLDLARETREELARFTEAIDAGGSTKAGLHVVSGPAAQTVCDIALREQVDLIVLGTHGMSGASHALFGSTTEGVLRRADTPVFVIPDSWTPPRPDTADLSGMGPVIAAIECSSAAMAGAAAATVLARAINTSVSVIHVVPQPTVLERWRPHADLAVAQQIEKARSEIATALTGLKIADIPLRIETGPVAQRLAEAAEAAGPHTILVLGRHARDSRRGAPGAVAYRVLGLAQVPVLVQCLAEGQS